MTRRSSFLSLLDAQPCASHQHDIADLGLREMGVHPLPEQVVAVQSGDLVGEAIDEFEHEPFAFRKALPLVIEGLGIGIKLFLDRLGGEIGPVAPHADAVADRAPHHRRHRAWEVCAGTARSQACYAAYATSLFTVGSYDVGADSCILVDEAGP
jgi:hypothetical protein